MKKEHYRGRYLNISTPGVLIVDLARKQSGIVWAGVSAHAYRHANIHAGVLVDVCVFPPRKLQSRSRRGMADGGCESEFQSGLTDRGVSVRDVVSPGLSVAGGVWTEQS